MKPSILTFDTLDDRRELHTLLGNLCPENRVLFLARCCLRTPGTTIRPNMRTMGVRLAAASTDPQADMELTNEVYADLLILSSQWGLPLFPTACDLEDIVRRPQMLQEDHAAHRLFRESLTAARLAQSGRLSSTSRP